MSEECRKCQHLDPTNCCCSLPPICQKEADDAYQKGKDEAIDNILKAIRATEDEPQYLHDGEDWINGLIIAEELVEQIKEKEND